MIYHAIIVNKTFHKLLECLNIVGKWERLNWDRISTTTLSNSNLVISSRIAKECIAEVVTEELQIYFVCVCVCGCLCVCVSVSVTTFSATTRNETNN